MTIHVVMKKANDVVVVGDAVVLNDVVVADVVVANFLVADFVVVAVDVVVVNGVVVVDDFVSFCATKRINLVRG